MNGVTGRMGTNQHLARSVMAIRREGGVRLADGTRVIPDPILVGRNPEKLKKLAAEHGVGRWTTDLDGALANPDDAVFFDAASTKLRPAVLKKAIAARKHIYCEKPVATSLALALDLYRAAKKAGVRHGVVQDKLWLPGLLKVRALRDAGFFGQILSVRGEFGYWVFEGDDQPAQRPSWNYRKKDGGGIILDMLCHWRYVLDNLFGEVKSVSCLGARHIATRWDENGRQYGTTPRTQLSGSRAGSSPSSIARGACECAAMTWQFFRWTERRALPWPGSHAVLPSPLPKRPGRYGTRTCVRPIILARTGRRFRTTSLTTTPSRRNGSFSSATYAKADPSGGTCWRV